jgi:hypothetical protein
VEGYSSRLQQMEERISELKDKTENKEKNWRNVSQTTQELWKEYRRTHWLHQKTKPKNHEVQAKEIHNIFNKIKTENFPNLEKLLPIQVQKASRTPNRLGKI